MVQKKAVQWSGDIKCPPTLLLLCSTAFDIKHDKNSQGSRVLCLSWQSHNRKPDSRLHMVGYLIHRKLESRNRTMGIEQKQAWLGWLLLGQIRRPQRSYTEQMLCCTSAPPSLCIVIARKNSSSKQLLN